MSLVTRSTTVTAPTKATRSVATENLPRDATSWTFPTAARRQSRTPPTTGVSILWSRTPAAPRPRPAARRSHSARRPSRRSDPDRYLCHHRPFVLQNTLMFLLFQCVLFSCEDGGDEAPARFPSRPRRSPTETATRTGGPCRHSTARGTGGFWSTRDDPPASSTATNRPATSATASGGSGSTSDSSASGTGATADCPASSDPSGPARGDGPAPHHPAGTTATAVRWRRRSGPSRIPTTVFCVVPASRGRSLQREPAAWNSQRRGTVRSTISASVTPGRRLCEGGVGIGL